MNLDTQYSKQTFASWKTTAFCLMCIGTICCYLVTSSFSAMTSRYLINAPCLPLLVFMGLAGLARYIISGMLSDKYHPIYIMVSGLIITGALNVCFGLLPQSATFFFWPLHVFFRAFGYVSCICLLTCWYTKSRLGVMGAFWFASYSIVTIITPIWVSSGYLRFIAPQIASLLSGLIAITIGAFIFFNRNKSILCEEKTQIDSFRGIGKLFYNEVIKNRYFWLLMFSCIMLVAVRFFMTFWLIMYLQEVGAQVLSHSITHKYKLLFETSGVLGILFAGIASDHFTLNHRLKISTLFGCGIMACMLIFWLLLPVVTNFYGAVLIVSAGFFISALQMLIFITIAKWSSKQVKGITTGFVMLFVSTASVLFNPIFGILVNNLGWNYCFLSLCACISLVMLVNRRIRD